jgi:hypothetical protein
MAFAEDLTPFFADFGVDATIGAATVRGIFDNDFITSMGLVAGTGPVLLCASASVSAVTQGASVTIASIGYTVTGIEPDGTGMTLLRMQEA